MIGFALGISVMLNILMFIAYKGVYDNCKKEIKKIRRNRYED